MLKFQVLWNVMLCDWRIKITVDSAHLTSRWRRVRSTRRYRFNYSLSSATFLKTTFFNLRCHTRLDTSWPTQDTLLQAYQQIVVYHEATGRDFISRSHLFDVVRHVILQCPQSLCFPQEVEIKFHTHINLLTPNVNYSGRIAPLTSKVSFYIFIQQI